MAQVDKDVLTAQLLQDLGLKHLETNIHHPITWALPISGALICFDPCWSSHPVKQGSQMTWFIHTERCIQGAREGSGSLPV